MGILSNTDNNIVIDAVLTDVGRQALARNDGSFNIVRFSVGDDEVQYFLYTTYGRTIAQEKIEKNSVVFQASTDQNIAMKSKCFSISNPNLIRLPKYALTGVGISGDVVTLGKTQNTTAPLTLTQTQQNTQALDPEIQDTTLKLKIDNRFLSLDDWMPNTIDNKNMATYSIQAGGGVSAINGAIFNFTIRTRPLTDNDFTLYGNVNDKTQITTIINATSLNLGTQKDITVLINKNT